MKFGMLHLFESPSGKSEYQVVKEQMFLMRAAEDLGFDSVWPAEHHFTEYGYCSSPALSLAAVASATHKIRLGAGVAVLPFHNPIRAAEEFAMLDLISDGRLEFGIGRGYQPAEFKGFGIDQAHARGIFSESLEIIRQAWTQERVNFKGAHFDIEDQPVHPKPLQRPHPPIWIAALSKASFAMAAQMGFNLLCAPVFGLGASDAVLLNSYREGLRSAGFDPASREIGALCMVYCGETTAQARRDFADPVTWFYRTMSKYVAPTAGALPAKTYENYAATQVFAASVSFQQLLDRGAVICGDRDHCLKRMLALRKRYGMTTLLCWTRMGGLDGRKVLRSMELMQKHVIPEFRKAERLAA